MITMFRILLAALVVVYGPCYAWTMQAHLGAGWYPNKKKALENEIARLDQRAEFHFDASCDQRRIKAILVPHAGYDYSGVMAAAAYRQINGTLYDRIIVLAPSHFGAFQGVVYPSCDSYQIPTGDVLIDSASIEKLKKQKRWFTQNDDVFAGEHSFEVQLPFIHFYAPDVPVLPLLVGDVDETSLKSIVKVLKKLITDSTLIVISSDLVHHGERFDYTPFSDDIVLNVLQMNSQALQYIQACDRKGFKNYIRETGATICGRGPIELALALLADQEYMHGHVVAYGDSTPVSGDADNLVGYAAVIFTQDPNDVFQLQGYEKDVLKGYAWNMLQNSFDEVKKIDEALLKPVMTPAVQKPSAVFVTLYKKTKTGKELRGCIGTTIAAEPLWQAVGRYVREAAFHDPRFEPVQFDESKNLMFEISVLTEPHSIASYKDIELGKHGIILSKDGRSALFLPKVAEEFGWNLEQTLDALNEKAGLPKDAWRLPGTSFQVFQTIDF